MSKCELKQVLKNCGLNNKNSSLLVNMLISRGSLNKVSDENFNFGYVEAFYNLNIIDYRIYEKLMGLIETITWYGRRVKR